MGRRTVLFPLGSYPHPLVSIPSLSQVGSHLSETIPTMRIGAQVSESLKVRSMNLQYALL